MAKKVKVIKQKTAAGDLAVFLRQLVEELEKDPSKELDSFKSRISGRPKSQSVTVDSIPIGCKVLIKFFYPIGQNHDQK